VSAFTPEDVRRLLDGGDPVAALEAAAGPRRAWLSSGELEAGRSVLAAVLAAPGAEGPTATRARVLYGDGLLAFRQGAQEESRARNEEALRVARAAADPGAESLALTGLSRVAFRDGDYAQVRALAAQARSIARETGEREAELAPLHMLAAGTRLGGDYAAARELYEESIELQRELGRESEHRGIAMEQHNLGWVELHLGDVDAAARRFAERDAVDSQEAYDVAWRDVNAAALAAARGDRESAARLLVSGEAALTAMGMALDPDDAFELDWLRGQLA